MTYIITNLWVCLTTAGLLMNGAVFNLAVTSTILLIALLLAGIFVFVGCVAIKRYDALASLPKRNRVLRAISTVVDFSPGVAIASVGHPILGAGYIAFYGVGKIIGSACMAISREKVEKNAA